MTAAIGAETMLHEIDRLADDLPSLVDAAFAAPLDMLRQPFRQIVLTGCGDSLQAAEAAAPVFAEHTGCAISVAGPRRLAGGFDLGRADGRAPNGQLVIGVSASGGTPAICEALSRARDAGAATLALVGRPNSQAAAIAHSSLVLPVDPAAIGPGIRTYQASLVGLFVLAIRMAIETGGMPQGSASRWAGQLGGLAVPLRETIDAARPFAARIAQETAGFPVMFFLAAGQHLATARYVAAKRVEASGLYAVGQDLEEAWHIERFASPRDLPVAVIAPPGSTANDAAIACLNARGAGRRLYTLSDPGDDAVRRHAHMALDLARASTELLSPLISHPVFTQVVAHEAMLLGQKPFRADRPEIAADLASYRKRMGLS